MENDKRLLTVNEVAEILRIAPRTIYNRCGRKTKNPLPFKVRRVGRSVRFLARDIFKYMEEL
jgi:predicted DNA-binding transcriptional regulator AlpA